MATDIIYGQLNSSMSRVPIDIEGIESYFYKGWNDAKKQEFYQQHVGTGKITLYLISKNIELEFKKIVSKARSQLEVYTVPHKEGTYKYFTKKSLEMYLAVFKKYQDEYFKLLDDVCKKYDKMREKFLKDACQFAETRDEKEILFQALNADILPVKTFREQFELKVTYYDDEELNYRRSLGKAIGIAYGLIDIWERSFKNNSGIIRPNALDLLDDKLNLISVFDIRKDPDLNSILQDFINIKNVGGRGKTTELNLRAIKANLENLAMKFDVMDFLK